MPGWLYSEAFSFELQMKFDFQIELKMEFYKFTKEFIAYS